MVNYLIFLCLLAILQHAKAVYLLIGAQEKCYTLEAPRDTPMVFNYEIYDSQDVGKIGFSLYYGTLPDKSLQIKADELKTKEGTVDYVADNDGFYCYCLTQLETLNSPTRIEFLLTYGFDDKYYTKLLDEHNFDSVNLLVHKLNDILTMTLNEADYQKHKEVDYHIETEKMNNAALWWPVLQIGILIFTGVCQVQHLKNFFKSNKFI